MSFISRDLTEPKSSYINCKRETTSLGVPPGRQHVELKRRTLSRVRHSRVHHFRVHHTAFTSEDGEHKQQHGTEVLPGNASRAITHERMMKQRELCMLLERLLSLDPRSLFNRHAVCILQRIASCPLCSIFFLFPGCQFWRASRWRCSGFQHSEWFETHTEEE